ncbi:MAG: 2-(1,2-epoxy-1,2-dihydrophenyl)acetyl-CoA isomerase, partial [Alphaproteobacteria bacterium 62-8]
MRTDFERAYVTAHGNVAVLTLNHPEVMNAASPKLVAGATEALKFISKPESGFRAVILTGEGRGFCSGANLSERSSGTPMDSGDSLQIVFHPFLRRLRNMKMPIITAVNGAAAGVGMSIALMGDIILAARSAYFLQAFTRIGLVPDGGSTWTLPRLVGTARARELSLLAEKLPAETALQWGLINRIHDDAALMDEALKLAQRLA